ncbi:unnamed protein product [Urochloa humidicola]
METTGDGSRSSYHEDRQSPRLSPGLAPLHLLCQGMRQGSAVAASILWVVVAAVPERVPREIAPAGGEDRRLAEQSWRAAGFQRREGAAETRRHRAPPEQNTVEIWLPLLFLPDRRTAEAKSRPEEQRRGEGSRGGARRCAPG